ncbi:MAG: UDP-N-acetylmuramyl-tripeptide synthetase [Deltaproteobacteria bacterium]|nr:UDP-N-acetylmuramyl-tripeptide synthetase [Deltaproteobacteria bacterium]
MKTPLKTLEKEQNYYRVPIINSDFFDEAEKLLTTKIGSLFFDTIISCKPEFVSSHSRFAKKSLVILLGAQEQHIQSALRLTPLVVHDNPNLKKGFFSKLTKNDCSYLKHLAVGNVSKHFHIFGVTGTKGKTTTAFFLYQILESLGFRPAYVGTLGVLFDGMHVRTLNTTPSLEYILNALLKLRDWGCKSIALECSSIGLDQGRCDGLFFDGAIFTGLGHDHLDYHRTMRSYFTAKLRLFKLCAKSPKRRKTVVFIMNSKWSRMAYLNCPKGLKKLCVYPEKLRIIEADPDQQITASYEKKVFKTNFFFEPFIISAIACVKLLNSVLNSKLDLGSLSSLILPPGRLEKIAPLCFIDYAHTEESIREVLVSLKKVINKPVVVVFGCGGDRDKSKRPKMGKVATTLADYVILTSDNPRSEDPAAIIHDIVSGVKKNNYQIEIDRKRAIQKGLKKALELNGIALIAGKGHETVQILKNKTIPFSDKKVCLDFLRQQKCYCGSLDL